MSDGTFTYLSKGNKITVGIYSQEADDLFTQPPNTFLRDQDTRKEFFYKNKQYWPTVPPPNGKYAVGLNTFSLIQHVFDSIWW